MSSTTFLLRAIAFAVGLGLVVLAFNLHEAGSDKSAMAVLILEGALIIAGVVFERQRYRPKIESHGPDWTKTGEKFIDPTTGKLTEVIFNQKTGERDYIEPS